MGAKLSPATLLAASRIRLDFRGLLISRARASVPRASALSAASANGADGAVAVAIGGGVNSNCKWRRSNHRPTASLLLPSAFSSLAAGTE